MADRFENTDVSRLLAQADNPAAPAGLADTAGRAGRRDPFAEGTSLLQSWVGDDYVSGSSAWYGGQNLNGPSNGWDTEFFRTAAKQFGEAQDAAAQSGDARDFFNWFKRKDATGVALWNDPKSGIRVGDVYRGGKQVANLYDDFDEKTANVLIAEFAVDASTREHIFAGADRDQALAAEVRRVVDANTELAASADDKAGFAAKVEDRKGKLKDDGATGLLTLGGAVGGGGLAAGLVTAGAGLTATGVGAEVGVPLVAAGAAIGALGSWLNRDQLTEMAARAWETTSLANRRFGTLEAYAHGAQEWGGLALREIMPVSNLVQGGYDWRAGTLGDGRAEFYEVDENGNRKAGKLVRGLDLAATLADSMLQFGSGAGVGAYLGLTGVHVAGSAAELSLTGAGFDDRVADFHKFEGAKEWAAAVGSVGIDAVQMGFAGALAKAGTATRAAFAGEATAGTPGKLAAVRDRLMPWGKAPEGTEVKHLNGAKFFVDPDTGKAVGAKLTWTLLAPSESLRWVPTAWRARTRAALSGGAVGPDDYYRAALELAGGNRFRYAVINGWAEGSEEGIQEFADQQKFSAGFDGRSIVESYLYGAAAGAGMSVGRISAPPSSDTVAKARAKSLYQRRNGLPEMPEQDWDKIWGRMSKGQRARAVLPTEAEIEELRALAGAVEESLRIDESRTSTIGAMAMSDLRKSAYGRDLANVNPAVDGTLVLRGMSADHTYAPDGTLDGDLHPANSALGTAWQTVHNVVRLHEGLQVQADDLAARLQAAQATLAKATESGDQAAIDAATQRLARLQAEVADTNGLVDVSAAIVGRLTQLYEEYRPLTGRDAEDKIDEINAFLADAFHGRLTDEAGQLLDERIQELARRSVELKLGRHPFIDTGSFTLLMPRVSKSLTLAGAHGTVYSHQAGLKALGGDYDGDTQVTLNTAYLPQAQLDAMRSGHQFVQTVPERVPVTDANGDPVLDAEGNPVEKTVERLQLVVDAPDAEVTLIDLLAEGFRSQDPARYQAAYGELTSLISELYDRYTGTVEDPVLTRLLTDFYAAVKGRDHEARLKLARGLFEANTQGMLALGNRPGQDRVPEMLWLMQRISRSWDAYQKAYAANAPEMEYDPQDVDAPQPADKAFQRALAVQEAATDGLTISTLLSGTSPVRQAQKLHYSALYRSAVDLLKGDLVPEQVQEFISLFAALGSNVSESEMARVESRHRVQQRALGWLEKIAADARQELGANSAEALLLIANTAVRDVRFDGDGQYTLVDGDVTLLQLLLRRSVEVEKNLHRDTLNADPELQRKLDKLEGLTRRNTEDAGHSVTAQMALLEVLGHVPVWRLLGDSAKYLGPQLTPNQLVASLANRTSTSREQQVHRWQRKAPYAVHVKVGNPPLSAAEAASGKISSYQVLVDAVTAVARKKPADIARKGRAALKNYYDGHTWLHEMIGSFRAVHEKRLGSAEPREVLRAMLDDSGTGPGLAATLAALIPDAAKLGAFKVIDGRAFSANWVLEALANPDPKKSAVDLIVFSTLEQWRARGGNIEAREQAAKDGAPKPEPTHPYTYGKLSSRLEQTIYQLALQPDGFELDRLVHAMRTAPSVEALFEQINAEPAWRGDRAPLVPFYDDVALFDADPSQVWTANLPGTVQREAIAAFAKKTRVLSQAMAAHAQQLETERLLLDEIETHLNGGRASADGQRYAELLQSAIANRVAVPDHTGRAAYTQLLRKLFSGIFRMQDKGKADPAAAVLGEPLVTMDEFGFKQSVFREADALTKYDVADITSNPTKLVDGPVRVGLPDGSEVVVDLSTPAGALAALKDPSTNALAKAALFPVARDVDGNNTVQSYQDVRKVALKTMLEEQTFADLFPSEAGGRPSPAQAYKLIGLVEAKARKAALGGDEQAQQQAFFPVLRMLSEYVVAYTHHVGADRMNTDQATDELVVDLTRALLATATLAAQDPSGESLKLARDTLQAKLKARFGRDLSAVQQLFSGGIDQAAADLMSLDAVALAYNSTALELKEQLADRNLTPAERADIQHRLDLLAEKTKARTARLAELLDDDVVASAINMFVPTGGDKVADLTRKTEIRRFLGANNRIGKFAGNYQLLDKINAVLAYDPLDALASDKISEEEWKELGAYAATVYVAELSTRSGSAVTQTPLVLGAAGESQRRLFDHTWGYLVDGLFDPKLLEHVQFFTRAAHYNPETLASDVAGLLESTLLSEKKLGKWTDRVPGETLKGRQVLANGSVGAALPLAGDDPKTMAALVGAGWNLFAKPDASMLEQRAFNVDPATGAVAWTPSDFLKLNNHFAAQVVLRGTPADGGAPEVDLMPLVGQPWLGDESVRDSGYQVISVARLDDAIARTLAERDLADVTVEISYFDVDTKPHHRDWANNVYFDGVGRDSATSTGPGPIAEMVFGSGALSKVGQQNPMDMVSKSGRGYRAIETSPLATALAMEGSSGQVAEVIAAKALHQLGKEYDTGFLVPADITALYKYHKQRHVVIGYDAAGAKQVWWAEQAIKWQSDNPGKTLDDPDFPLKNARLWTLTEQQMQTLLGEPGDKGLPGVISPPVLNVADLDPMPALDADRLARLGLTRLGETATLADAFAGYAPLPRSSYSEERGQENLSRYEERTRVLREQQLQIRTVRVRRAEFPIDKINEPHARRLEKMLGLEALAPVLAKLGVPFPELRDMTEVELSQALLAKLREAAQVDPTNVIWLHRQGDSGNPAMGVLSDVTLRAGLPALDGPNAHLRPTLGDFVILELASFLTATGGDYEAAYEQAKAAAREYAKTGVTLVLAAEGGAATLRTDLAAHLREGAEGYAPLAESAHFFAPVSPDSRMHATEQALESTLTATRQFTARSVALKHLSDRYGSASSENHVYLSPHPDQPLWQSRAVTLLPTQVGNYFGLPARGVGPLDQAGQVRDLLLPLLKDPAVVEHLRKLGGDPAGVPVHRVNPNGTEEPGIRSFDDAIARLVDQLESGVDPLRAGSELRIGDFVVTLSSGGRFPGKDAVLLTRVGFRLPDAHVLRDQLRTPLGQSGPVDGELGLNVAVATNELDPSWTTRGKVVIEQVAPDPTGGTLLKVKYDLNDLVKGIAEGDGFKAGFGPMPNDLAAPDQPLAGNGLRVTQFGTRKAPASKESLQGLLYNDFGWAFALSGIDFRPDMVEFFYGRAQRSPEEIDKLWKTVAEFLTVVSRTKPGLSASDIAAMLDDDTFMASSYVTALNAAAEQMFGEGFQLPGAGRFDKPTDPVHRLGQVMIAALMAPRVQLEHVISTSGLMSLERLDSGAQITLMPQLFTDALNDYSYPALREMLVDRVNANLTQRNPDGSRVYTLTPDWRFVVAMQNPQTGAIEHTDGVLQLLQDYAADENPVDYVQASIRSQRQGQSQHVAQVFAGAAGGRMATERATRETDRIFDDTGIERFTDEGSTLWSMLHAVPEAGKDSTWAPWQRLMPLQQAYLRRGHAKVVKYMQPIDMSGPEWDGDAVARYHAVVDKILARLNLTGEGNRTEVDYWVRQFFGVPAEGPGDPAGVGQVSPEVALQAAELILENVRAYRIPTYGGVVPLVHETILELIHREQAGKLEPWAPRMSPNKRAKLATKWEEWVRATFGQVRDSEELFDPAFRVDLDGFMHTYQAATEDLGTTPISLDELTDLKLMDPKSSEFLLSMDPLQQAQLSDPVVLETTNATLDALVGHDAAVAFEAARDTPTSELAKRIEKHTTWARSRKLQKPEKTSLKHYIERGAWYTDKARDTHTVMHNLFNASIGMRLLNPALWTSAIFEVYARTTLENTANLLTGTATGPVGKAVAAVGEKVGWQPQFDAQQIEMLNHLAEKMGVDNAFLAVIYDELHYRNLIAPGRKKIGHALESFARFSATATSDPRFGMMARSLAKRYIEAAWEYLDATDNAITFETFVSNMNEDPLWLEKQFPAERGGRSKFSPHQAGLNRIAQVRSVKASVPAKALMGGIDSMTRNPHASVNFMGYLAKIPFAFTRFNANSWMTLAGLGGFDQMAAMFLDQRQSPLLGRVKAGLLGVRYDEAVHDPIDMSDVIEGIDLTRPFLKGAVTHTGLMGLALMAGGLGLSGEDDEAKRRRRLATFLGTPYYYDPTQAQNDIAFADALFLDSIPWLSNLFKAVPDGHGGARSAVVPHWILKQFISPVMGIERFISTGDFRNVKWGFADAYSVMPTSVVRLWKDAELTADALSAQALAEAGMPTPEAQGNATRLLMNGVSIYERALFENSFVNALRNGSDKYNRNAFLEPMTKDDGSIVRDKLGNPVPTDALQSFRDPVTGEVRKAYVTRSGVDAEVHQAAENSIGVALLASLFTGQWGADSTYLRHNMVPSGRDVKMPELSKPEAEALVLSALHGAGGLPGITQEEAERALKYQYQQAGLRWDQEQITAQAQQMVASQQGKGALSLLDADGREVLTKEGAKGIYRSLARDGLRPDDPSLRGVFIPMAMRHEIEQEWVADLIQEGVDLGLPEYVAKARAKRLWYGNTFEDPDATGLRAILYSQAIPTQGKIHYNQLNTTYVIGPDGMPWATPFQRQTWLQAVGLPLPHTAHTLGKGGMEVDGRGKAVDTTIGDHGINLGWSALERVDESWKPEPEEAKANLDKVFAKTYTPSPAGAPKSNGFHRYAGFRRSGGYRSGGGGGGGGGAYFTRMSPLPRSVSPYGNSIPAINTSNPNIRRANVRRERVWSERGRLNQWQ